ncbi:MAG TPA: redoxin domain-containing protein [Gemmataceae bacterium]|nr:redoxin domain-containing protein [Gemmataceae bacterium]
MRAVAYMCAMAGCLGLAGCSLFGKKAPATANPPNPPLAGNAWPTPPASPAGGVADQTVSRGSGILAGRVIDSYDRRPPPTFIQVVSAQEASGGNGAPVEVAADEQGFFTIHGLQPGRHYELIARTRDGAPRLAGRVWATPPNPRLLIYMSGDFATQNTPAAPGAPVVPGQKPSPTNSVPGADSANGPADGGQRGSFNPEQNADPASAPRPSGGQRGVDILPPVRLGDGPANSGPPSFGAPAGAAQPQAEIRPQDIVGLPNAYAQGGIPANIPPQGTVPVRVPPPSYALTAPIVPTQVPSCVLTGRQLDNFALYDINGNTWEYRNHRGRFVLLDFWGTWCTYCVAGIPHLKVLQDTYGPWGLEVVGIAYERGGTFQEQVRAVQGVRDRKKINYQLLLGGESARGACPVRTQFGIDAFPTLVLLDANNRIIWRERGLLDQVKLHDLKIVIESQLRLNQ